MRGMSKEVEKLEQSGKFYKVASFALVNLIAPFLLVFALSPSIIDKTISPLDPNRKILVQILCYSALFVLMMKSAKAAIGVTVWAIVIAVLLMAYELNNLLP